MKIVIAPDSFKGSLNAKEVAEAVERGIKQSFPNADTVLLPMADGGEGTMDILVSTTNGQKRHAIVTGPLGDQVTAAYGVLGDKQTCVIEVASASGLDKVPAGRLAPMKTTTYGTGELIKLALDEGFMTFIIGLGGSATNDGGAGMLQALGAKLLDAEGKEIGFGGGELERVCEIDLSSFDARIPACDFLIASDVKNPLIGPNGASHVFGPQKGATAAHVKALDRGLLHWADRVAEATGSYLHDCPGAGAAGGIGGAFQVFFPSEMKRGIEVVQSYSDMDKHLEGADVVVTGEGRIDTQSLSGKTPMGVIEAAKRHGVPTVIIAGAVEKGITELIGDSIVSIHSIANGPMAVEESIANASELLAFAAEQIMRTYFYQMEIRKGGYQLENNG